MKHPRRIIFGALIVIVSGLILLLTQFVRPPQSRVVLSVIPPLEQWVGDSARRSDWSYSEGSLFSSGSSWLGVDAHLPDKCRVTVDVSKTSHLGGVFISVFTPDPNPRVVYSPEYRMASYYTIHLDWSGVTLKKIDDYGKEVWLPTVQTEYFYHRTESKIALTCDRLAGRYVLTADGIALADWTDPSPSRGSGSGFSIQAFAGDEVFSLQSILIEDLTLESSISATHRANKTVVATAGNVPRSLRSVSSLSAVPHL